MRFSRLRASILLTCGFLFGTHAFRSVPVRADSPQPERLASQSPFPTNHTQTLTIPAETEANVVLLSGIHTRVSRTGDFVAARLVEPLSVDGQVALPSGSLLRGEITRVRAAGHLNRSAALGFRFSQVLLPDGETQPIEAVLASLEHPHGLRVDREGYVTGGSRFPWRQFGAFGGAGGLTAVGIGIGGAAAGTAFPLAAVGLVGYEVFWHSGKDVHLPPDTRCRIRLDYPLTVRLHF